MGKKFIIKIGIAVATILAIRVFSYAKDSKIKYSPKKYAKDTNSNSKIRVKINNIEALKSIINLDIDMIYYEDVATLEQAMAMAAEN